MNRLWKDPVLWVCLAVVGGSLFLLERGSTGGFFPKHKEEFLSPKELEAVISRTEARILENPEDMKALVELGMAYFQTEDEERHVKTANALEKARDLGSLDPRIFYYLAVSYEALNVPTFAVLWFERHLRNFPEDVETRIRLANLLYNQKNYVLAISHYEQARDALRREDPILLINLGLAYKENNQRPEALKTLEAARSIWKGPWPKDVSLELGILYSENGDWDKALSSFQDEERVNPDSVELTERLAEAYEKKQMISEAVAAWEKVLTLKPSDSSAKKKIRSLKAAPQP